MKSKKDKKNSTTRCRVLVANGVNLDLLGQREPTIYGLFSLEDIRQHLAEALPSLIQVAGLDCELELEFFQSNQESLFLEKLDGPYSGILINAGAWTHTSIALADRLKGLGVPYVEVHISNTFAREEFRHKSYLSAAAVGVVVGFGVHSYEVGLLGLLQKIGPTLRRKPNL